MQVMFTSISTFLIVREPFCKTCLLEVYLGKATYEPKMKQELAKGHDTDETLHTERSIHAWTINWGSPFG